MRTEAATSTGFVAQCESVWVTDEMFVMVARLGRWNEM
jgi:hypothetical protein